MKTSRERILNSLREAGVEKIELPKTQFQEGYSSLELKFLEMANKSGMEIMESPGIDLMEVLNSLSLNKNVQSAIEEHQPYFPMLFKEEEIFDQDKIPDIFVCEARFGVSENAALWLDDEVLPSRILGFLPEEIIILLDRMELVPTMHEAYELVEKLDYTYGLFLAGPSKTADIEQTLVTGAQGAKRIKIFLS